MMNIFQSRRGSADLDFKRDYISNLPTNVKEVVLMKLPIKEAVRTSLLSTKWKNAWMPIPNLMFKEEGSLSKLIRLVDLVLLLHRGPILQFKLISEHACNEAICRWMLILSRNGIKNLQLYCDEKCMIPSSFFSCLALEHVCISCSTIHIPPSFLTFKFLRTLDLSEFKSTGITMARLISSCPLLERLELSYVDENGRLVIHAPNLRWLRISGHFGDLCLETPKLHFADITLDNCMDYYQNFSLPSKDCKSNILRVLGSLSAIEELELGCVFISVRDPFLRKFPSITLMYLAMEPIPEVFPAPLHRLKKLHIDLCSYKEEIDAAFCLFKSAPNLKVLSFMLGNEPLIASPPSFSQYFWEVKRISPDLFNCLEIVSIWHFDDPEQILEVAKFIMSTAPVLKKLIIGERCIDYLMDGMAFLKKLASFPRLSTMAEISYDIKES